MELRQNCRIPFRALAKKLGVTFKTIRNRVNKLIMRGVIHKFVVWPSGAMMDMELLFAILSTDGSVYEGELLDRVGSHPMVINGSVLFNGDIKVTGYYAGSKGLADLGKFLRSQPSVTDVEIHTILTEPGRKCELTQADVKVLRCLQQDARMSVVKITEHTQLTPKRVRKSINKILPEGGSLLAFQIQKGSVGSYKTAKPCFRFTLLWRLNLSDHTMCVIHVKHDDEKTSYFEITEKLKQNFTTEYFYSYASASEPISFNVFLFEHPRMAEPILTKIRKLPHITQVKPRFNFEKRFYRNYSDIWMENLFRQAKV